MEWEQKQGWGMEYLNKNKRFMFITVGTGREGKDIASAIVKSIENHHPDEIIFFCTERSKEVTLPLIEEIFKGKGYYYKWDVEFIEDENDFESIKNKCAEIIEKYRGIKIVDYTSGTKAMSVGIVLASLEKGVDIISYITGKRDKGGRVIPETERIYSFTPSQIYAYELYKKSIEYFNIHRFNLAKDLLEKCVNLYREESFASKVKLLIELCEMYFRWDIIDYSGAWEISKKIDNIEGSNELLKELKIKNKFEMQKELLYKMKSNYFMEERIIDLYKNAERRFEENKYDDAVARLYRLLEYVLQFLINKRDLYKEAGNKIDKDKLPENLKEKYAETLPLAKSAELLYELNDEIGKEIYKKIQDGELKKILSARNSSILAHGFNPVGKDSAQSFLKEIEGIIKRMIKEEKFEKLYKDLEFPEIKGAYHGKLQT